MREMEQVPGEAALTQSDGPGVEPERLAAYRQRCRRKPVGLKYSPGQDKSALVVEATDPEAARVMMAEAMGTVDEGLQAYLMVQAVETFRGFVHANGQDYEKLGEFANRAMALLNGIQPGDEIEAMLGVQMIGVHNAAMDCLRRAQIVGQTFEGEEAYINRANKLLRTFTVQMEALKRYRTGGQQKVVVEHVHVNEGGQAIVGNVSTGGGGNDPTRR